MPKEIESAKDQLICLHEREWGEFSVVLKQISKEVNGNGVLGLAKTVPRLEVKINKLVTAVASHTKVISNLIEFQASHNGEEKGKKEAEIRQHVAEALKLQTDKDIENKKNIADALNLQRARDKRNKRMGWIMAVLAFISVSSVIYFGFRNLNKSIKAEIKTEIEKIK